MKILVSALAISLLSAQLFAQAVVPPNIRATNTLERLHDIDRMGVAEVLYGIPLPEGRVVGDTYIDTAWRQCSILLYDNNRLLEGYPARYDIHLDLLEISARNGIRVLKGGKIKSFVWMDARTGTPGYFINSKELSTTTLGEYGGFFKVLTEGPMPLFERIVLDVKKADYNIQFNVGSVDDKILKVSEYYTQVDGVLLELPTSRKKLVNIFDGKYEEMKSFMKKNKISVDDGEQLKVAFQHYNALVEN